MGGLKEKKNKEERNKPKVRNFRRFWYLEKSWKMPDMHPMLLEWRVSAATFSLYEDDDPRVSCLFIDPLSLSLSLSLTHSFMCENFYEYEVQQLEITVINWVLNWKKERKNVVVTVV